MSLIGLGVLNIKNEVERGEKMVEIKSIVAGALFLYAAMLLLSAFNLATLVYVPIRIYEFEVGKIMTALIIGAVAYFLVKRR